MEQLLVDALNGQLDVPDDAASDEAVFNGEQVGVELCVGNRDVFELNVQVLVYAVDTACDADVVLELHRDLVVGERLEERVEEHVGPILSLKTLSRGRLTRGSGGGV